MVRKLISLVCNGCFEMVEAANANKHANDLEPINAITKDDYVFPLPLSEILANPNLE